MDLPKIKKSDFPNWKSYYLNYQKLLAQSFYIPLLSSKEIDINAESKILDVGCGDGGFLSAFSELSKECHGNEIRDFSWGKINDVKFIIGDICSEEIKERLMPKYDLVILRDVIEHILKDKKINFLSSVKNYMDDNSRLLVTFPPYFSAFGLHQQAFLKMPFKVFPFLGWLPKIVIYFILKITNQSNVWEDLEEIKNSKMTIRNFRRLIDQCGFEICFDERYIIRPSHEIRYGIKMKKANWLRVPLLEEVLISGCTFILKIKS